MSNLPIPAEALEDCGAVLGKRGSGKSNSLMVLLEHELDAGHRSVMIDPKGDRWGVRLNPDKSPSRFNIPIFGGRKADYPVSADLGETLGLMVAENDVSCLIDLSLLSIGDKQKFMMGFAPVLLTRNRAPLTLFVEEVHQFANQDPRYQPPMLVHHIANFGTLGRTAGVVLWMASQRPAQVNATVRSQNDTIIGHKVTSPLDRDALHDWFKGATKAFATRYSEEAGELAKGEAFVWSSEAGFTERVQFPMASTYDSGRTPKHGDTIEDVVLPKLSNAAIAAMLANHDTPIADAPAPKAAKAAADPDPRDARIAELVAANQSLEKTIELMKRRDGTAIAALDSLGNDIARLRDRLAVGQGTEYTEGTSAREGGEVMPTATSSSEAVRGARSAVGAGVGPILKGASPPASAAGEAPDPSTLPPAQQRIIDQIAWACEAFHKSAVERQVLAIVLGVHPRTKGFLNNLGALRSAGLIDYPDGKGVALTGTGFAQAAVPSIAGAPLKQLRDQICKWLPAAQARILRLAIDAFPNAVARERLAELLNVHPRTKSLLNNLGRLRSLGLLAGTPAQPRAAGYLFGKD